MKSVTIPCSD